MCSNGVQRVFMEFRECPSGGQILEKKDATQSLEKNDATQSLEKKDVKSKNLRNR